MNIIEVFEELVIKRTDQILKQALEKLKKDDLLQKKLRELADISRDLKRIEDALITFDLDREVRGKWVLKSDELSKKREEMYSEIRDEGFENSWITTIVNNEMEKLDILYDDTRNNAYIEVFGKLDIHDIDIMDNRWKLVGDKIAQFRDRYIEGK